MTATIFDTHQAVQDLKQAGFDEKKAAAVVSTIKESIDDRVATKADLHTEIANLKVQLLLWIFACNGATIAILKLIL